MLWVCLKFDKIVTINLTYPEFINTNLLPLKIYKIKKLCLWKSLDFFENFIFIFLINEIHNSMHICIFVYRNQLYHIFFDLQKQLEILRIHSNWIKTLFSIWNPFKNMKRSQWWYRVPFRSDTPPLGTFSRDFRWVPGRVTSITIQWHYCNDLFILPKNITINILNGMSLIYFNALFSFNLNFTTARWGYRFKKQNINRIIFYL